MALPWIIFFRDAKQFSHDFQELEILYKEAHTPFRYLLSGGVSMKQLVPSFSYGFFKSVEHALRPFNNTIGCFCTIVVRKKLK
ncbi:Uncharacterised protein [uncultured archaeon]|nr:Uncharacterised protein [uncultured archaeon]